MRLRDLVADLSRQCKSLSNDFLKSQEEARLLRLEVKDLSNKFKKSQEDVKYWKKRAMSSERKREVSTGTSDISNDPDYIDEEHTFSILPGPEIEENENEEIIEVDEHEDLVHVISPNSSGISENHTFLTLPIPEIEDNEVNETLENNDLVYYDETDENNIVETTRVEDARTQSVRPRRVRKPVERYQIVNIPIRKVNKKKQDEKFRSMTARTVTRQKVNSI